MTPKGKYILLGFVFLTFAGIKMGICQNLVPNWSFEENNDSCNIAIDPGSFENLNIWLPKWSLQGASNAVSIFSTPDYYSSCFASSSIRPPKIVFAFQYPYHLSSLIGIIYHGVNGSLHDREAVRIQLTSPLKMDVCYHAEMFVNFANNSTYVCDKLGMACSVDSFSMFLDGTLPMPSPQVYTNLLIDDTLNWIKIEGNFIAEGGGKWLTIGWFFPTSVITYNLVGDTTALGIVTSAYYLIDAVQVYPCTDDEKAVLIPNLISPNGDGKNDLYVIDSLPLFSRVSFFNRWGNEIYNSDNYQNDWDGTWNGNQLPTGTYFVVVQMPHGTKKSTFVELVY